MWLAGAGSAIALVIAPPAQAQSRGELLYATHCIACHSSQMHWRDKRLATDWASLKAQVRRWQGAAMLGWSEEDIVEVTRYLNGTLYRFEQTSDPRSSPDPLPTQLPAAAGGLSTLSAQRYRAAVPSVR
jgi:mono/diheme cytochrome c family protein